ncbi:hypothetical protein LCGC14_1894850 [marine sediment metagenome]|uniref:Uncharacterized protein n=1 Tax=marine sediment metagenome TaxID=412755 RepID=A0A0F9FYD6_9ZZZZ
MGGLFETLSGAKGIRAEGKSAQNIANFNAEVSRQQAEAERIAAGFEQERQSKAAEKAKSRLRAQLGAAGGTGSPVAFDLTAEQAAELELENLLIGFEGEVRAGRAETQAQLDTLQGQLAKQRSKNLARAANIGFGTQVVSLGAPFLTGFGGKTPIANQAGIPFQGRSFA